MTLPNINWFTNLTSRFFLIRSELICDNDDWKTNLAPSGFKASIWKLSSLRGKRNSTKVTLQVASHLNSILWEDDKHVKTYHLMELEEKTENIWIVPNHITIPNTLTKLPIRSERTWPITKKDEANYTVHWDFYCQEFLSILGCRKPWIPGMLKALDTESSHSTQHSQTSPQQPSLLFFVCFCCCCCCYFLAVKQWLASSWQPACNTALYFLPECGHVIHLQPKIVMCLSFYINHIRLGVSVDSTRKNTHTSVFSEIYFLIVIVIVSIVSTFKKTSLTSRQPELTVIKHKCHLMHLDCLTKCQRQCAICQVTTQKVHCTEQYCI